MDWISEDSVESLNEAMELATEYSDKMKAFRSGLIEVELRKFQLAAHQAYDMFSSREKEVFLMRLGDNDQRFRHIIVADFPDVLEQAVVHVNREPL